MFYQPAGYLKTAVARDGPVSGYVARWRGVVGTFHLEKENTGLNEQTWPEIMINWLLTTDMCFFLNLTAWNMQIICKKTDKNMRIRCNQQILESTTKTGMPDHVFFKDWWPSPSLAKLHSICLVVNGNPLLSIYSAYWILIDKWLMLIIEVWGMFFPPDCMQMTPQQATCFSCSFSEPRLHRLQTCTCSRKGRNNPRFRKGSPGCSSAGMDAGWNGFAYRLYKFYNAINGEADNAADIAKNPPFRASKICNGAKLLTTWDLLRWGRLTTWDHGVAVASHGP